MNNGQEFWTKELSVGSITITDVFGLTALSFVLISGTGTYEGSVTVGGVPSTAINMVIGQPVTITTDSNNPINGFTITTTGVVAIIGKP
jgi:hypothetical protein